MAVTWPTIVLLGQLIAAAAATEHTVSVLLGSSARLSGSCTRADWMFPCPELGALRVAVRVGCLPLVVCPLPLRLMLSWGVNPSALQSPTWNRDETLAAAPLTDWTCPVMLNGEHEVGLMMKLGRSRVRLIVLIRSGVPCRMVGNGSDTAVTWASLGSIC